jgi:hypothetical protein
VRQTLLETEDHARSLKKNLALRLKEAEDVGTGLDVPAPTCSKEIAPIEVAELTEAVA